MTHLDRFQSSFNCHFPEIRVQREIFACSTTSMCGIAGFWHNSPGLEAPLDVLGRMGTALAYRASMAVSLEARLPLLDHRVVGFAWKLPLPFKIRNGTAKWILRQILVQFVPRELVEQPKMGSGVPIDSWLRGLLREWAEDLLSTESLRYGGFLEAGPIREKWEEHLSGARSWEYPLWNALMFQDWLTSSGRKATGTQLTGARAL